MFKMLSVFTCLLVTFGFSTVSPKIALAAPPDSLDVKAQGIAWESFADNNSDAIFARAKDSGRPVFLYWGAVWCPPCNQVKANVFNRSDFIAKSQLFIPVYLDGDSKGAQRLAAQFKVTGYPTMVLLNADGKELTRLPGEVDPAKYMQVLDIGIKARRPIKEVLAAALGSNASRATLQPADWRLLAFYSWDTDASALINPDALAKTLNSLAKSVPPELKDLRDRIQLRAIGASVSIKPNKLVFTDSMNGLLTKLLTNPEMSKQNLDIVLYQADSVLKAIASRSPAQAKNLGQLWMKALDLLFVDASLSTPDRLSAASVRFSVARLDLSGKASNATHQGSNSAPAPISPELVSYARNAVTVAVSTASDPTQRQAVIPAAADLLAEAGLLDESDALLKAELPKAIAPYYHMLGLAENAKTRKDTKAAVDWAAKAWENSKGTATRLQWGASYINYLVDLSPNDSARIERTALAIVAEVGPTPDMFYGRSARSLKRLASKLKAWNKNSTHQVSLDLVQAQLTGICKLLPKQDLSRSTCDSVFTDQKS